MPKIYYHPCPQALGEYNYLADVIILHEGLKRYREIHDSILRHERDHARIFKEHSSWLKRLVLNVKLDYEARITGATKVPLELLRELNPSTLRDNAYQTLYIIAYLPILLIEGVYFMIKGNFSSK
jgi:hypothetical protein